MIMRFNTSPMDDIGILIAKRCRIIRTIDATTSVNYGQELSLPQRELLTLRRRILALTQNTYYSTGVHNIIRIMSCKPPLYRGVDIYTRTTNNCKVRARKIYFIFKELYDCDNSINFKLKESNYQQNCSTTKLYLNARFFRFAKKSIDIFINTIYKIVQQFVVFIASLAVRLSEGLEHI